MKVSIFGLGYVGCVSLGCLAQNGHDVIGVDTNKLKVKLINEGKPTIIETEINDIIKKQRELNKISATTNFKDAIFNSDISIICVGTPSTDEGHLNLSYIFNSAEQIGVSLKEKKVFHVIVIRSTVLPGTNQKIGEIIEKNSNKKRNIDFSVVSNPEFLREGSAVIDYYNPSFTVLGSDCEKALDIMEEIYKNINAPVIRTEIKVAEIIKYVNNSFHALKVVFANEVGNICKILEIDSHKVMDLFCRDNQLNISSYYFKPGFAYGGSCLPKDMKALRTIAHDAYLLSPVLNAIEPSNENQKKRTIDMILKTNKKNIGFLGLSFKKGTDDLRNSPAVNVVEYLYGKGFNILIYDKQVHISKLLGSNREYIDKHIPHLSNLISDDLISVINKSDVLVVTQKLNEFIEIQKKYPRKLIIDLVRISSSKSNGNYQGICW